MNNGQFRETDNWQQREHKTKKNITQHNIVGHHYAQPIVMCNLWSNL
jgi:hypothetical protein